MICFYDFECDLGDGWEDAEVHKDSPEARQKALKVGANLISTRLVIKIISLFSVLPPS